jgi:hypothetical protein
MRKTSTSVFLSLLLASITLQAHANEVYSLAYFKSNASVAKATAERCMHFQKNAYSTMSPTQQRAWADTAEGINCKNARTAYAEHVYADHNRKMREAAASLK